MDCEENLKIQQIINSYGGLTGSEMYVYDLSRKLVELGHEVMVSCKDEPQNPERSLEVGIKLGNFLHPDIVHAHQTQSTQRAMLYGAPIVQTVHSEILPRYEAPLQVKEVKKYITVRESISKYVIRCGVSPDKVVFIPNGVDPLRFHPTEIVYPITPLPSVLFVGSDDFLRRDVIVDLVEAARDEHFQLILVGNGFNYNEENIVSIPPLFSVEMLTQRCSMTASVMVGRTTIEGWLCGKPGMVYNIDELGSILYREVIDPPKDLKKYKLDTMVKSIVEVYESVL